MNKIYFLLLLSMFGCASHSDKEFSDFEVKEVLNTFEIKEMDINRFETKDIKEEKVLKKNVVKKTISRKKTAKPKKVVEKKSVEVLPAWNPPADYPKSLLKLDEASEKVWENYIPNIYPGEKLFYQVNYMGIKAGYIQLLTYKPKEIDKKLSFHFEAKLKTADYYRYIYKLEDSVETFVDIEKFLPIKYTLIQRESNQTVDDLQIFDHEARKTYHWYKRVKKGIPTDRKIQKYIPQYMQDSFSALFFVRGLDMVQGKTYRVPVVTRGKIWILSMSIDRFEKVEIMGKKIDAIKIKAQTRFHGALKRKGDIIFWFSNDRYKRMLKFSASIKIGSVKGVLVEETLGSKL